MTGHTAKVAALFDENYATVESFWWNRPGEQEIRLSPNPRDHLRSLMTSSVLCLLRDSGLIIPRILDIGSGEGIDGVRYAKMGYAVTMVEISIEGLKKTEALARAHSVEDRVTLIHGAAQRTKVEPESYGLALSNGVLDYVEDEDKSTILHMLQHAVPIGGWNGVSTWTDFPPENPACHNKVPMYPDLGGEYTFGAYDTPDWQARFMYAENHKPDNSHPGEPHTHSHAKVLAQRVA